MAEERLLPDCEPRLLRTRAATFRPYAAGPRAERKLRAAERHNAQTCPRARVQGQGGGDRRTRSTTSLGRQHVSVATRDPARALRPRSTRDPEEDLAPRAVRA